MIVTAQRCKAKCRTESGLQARPLIFKKLQAVLSQTNRETNRFMTDATAPEHPVSPENVSLIPPEQAAAHEAIFPHR